MSMQNSLVPSERADLIAGLTGALLLPLAVLDALLLAPSRAAGLLVADKGDVAACSAFSFFLSSSVNTKRP